MTSNFCVLFHWPQPLAVLTLRGLLGNNTGGLFPGAGPGGVMDRAWHACWVWRWCISLVSDKGYSLVILHAGSLPQPPRSHMSAFYYTRSQAVRVSDGALAAGGVGQQCSITSNDR
jgi:hypothetical protein